MTQVVITADIDADRISPKLWVGAYPLTRNVTRLFDVIVLCARELQDPPPMGLDQTLMRIRLDDERYLVPPEKIGNALDVAREIAHEIAAGRRVLVSCAEGVNRSAFVACVVLMLQGATAHEAISLVRRCRKPHSGKMPLCNTYFQRTLMNMAPLLNRRQKAAG